MPYISKAHRLLLDTQQESAVTPGQLNYQLTKLISEYYRSHNGGYTAINDVIGALEGAKMEFYRRVAAPYEDKKIEENGDVY